MTVCSWRGLSSCPASCCQRGLICLLHHSLYALQTPSFNTSLPVLAKPRLLSATPGVFQCSADQSILDAAEKLASRRANPSDPCEGLDQASCNAKDECTWCKSAAVPSSCYTRVRTRHHCRKSMLPAASDIAAGISLDVCQTIAAK